MEYFAYIFIMKQSRLSKEKKEELFEMYQTYKYTYKELAELFNKSVNSIACLLNREGLKGKRVNNSFRKYDVNQNYFDIIDCEKKAYFLGFLCADGCNHTNNTKVSMLLHEKDLDILKKLNNLIQPNKPLGYYKKQGGANQYGLFISNRRISERLNELGCIPRKTFTLDFPNEHQVPTYLLKHYIRGFFDGDGWLGEKDISITSSIQFSEKLSKFLLKELGTITRMRYKNKVIELCFSRYSIKTFLNWIYKDSKISLDRKYQKYLKHYVK